MISTKMTDALNEQINAELYSAYLYLSMSAWFSDKSLSGFANWMRVQAQEEQFHAMKIYDYVLERGGSIDLKSIDKPEVQWNGCLDVLQEVAAHEAKVTGLINDLVDLAYEGRDHASNIFLQWFVSEQVEEEASVGDIVEKAKMIGDDSAGLFALDMELGKRVFDSSEDE
jgi:ferritin